MNLLTEIRRIPQAFRILRDEGMVFEFEFDSAFSSLPGIAGRQLVVVFVSCPLAGDDLLLPGCEVRLQRKSDNEILPEPASWQEDKERQKLRKLIEELTVAFSDREERVEIREENPRVTLVKEQLDGLAVQVAEVIMKDRVLDFHDLLSIHTTFSLAVVDQMFELYQKDHA